MKFWATLTFFLALITGISAIQHSAKVSQIPIDRQEITLAAAGPYHVAGNQIVDARGRAFLMRGTQLTDFQLKTEAEQRRSEDNYFGPHSLTSLTAIRLRFNMNTVRIPLNVAAPATAEYFARLHELVRNANDSELLVVLAASEPGTALPSGKSVAFWRRTAAEFKANPNVMFDLADVSAAKNAHTEQGWAAWRNAMTLLVDAVRSTGATQPVIAAAWNDGRMFEGADALPADRNVIYRASPHWTDTSTDAQRDAHFGALGKSVPMVASGWDVEFGNAAACAAIPTDPSAATHLIQKALDYFDAHQISWTASVYAQGKLIKDFSLQHATSLDDGWQCGKTVYPSPGMGRVLEAHLRATTERGLFTVSTGGGPDVARGGVAIAYGPIMASADVSSFGHAPPMSMGQIRVEVTDSRGVTRPAGLLWTSEGWGQVNYVVPQEAAIGPATMTIVREDGSRLAAPLTIADTAPGFWTDISCRGPARGVVKQVFADGHVVESKATSCNGATCITLPIPMDPGAKTTVRLSGGGFRNARSAEDIEVLIGGIRVPVVSYGPSNEPGIDQVTVELPASLRGKGDVDLIGRVNGRVSNAVRIRLGA